jgi:ABC-2 type transport system permease protein
MIRLIAFKELRSLFAAPSTWLMLGALQFIFAWFFLARLDAFLQVQSQLAQIANAPGATLSVAAPLFGTLTIILMMLIPLFTMRLLAEERRNHSLPLLLAAPVADSDIVLGKYLGLMLLLLLIIVGNTLMVLSLAAGTQLDAGLVLGNALGALLLAASYAALGLYISSLTAQPVVAAIGTLAMLAGMWLADIGAADSGHAWRMLLPTAHFQGFNTGLVSSADLAYFALFCTSFLLLAVRRLRNNRSYG